MSYLRHRGRTTALLAPLATIAALGLLAGCSTSTPSASSDSTSDASAVNADLAALLPDSIKDSGEISFDALWETPPVISVSTDDPTVPIGISPDIAAAIAPILGVKATWVNLQWPAQLPGLQSGNVDVLFGQVSVTKEREQGIVDLIPYTKDGQTILVAAGNPKGLESLANACGATIGVAVGSTFSAEVEGASEKFCTSAGEDAITIAPYPNASNAISAIKAGTIDGWVNNTSQNADVAASSAADFDTVEIPEEQTVDYDPGLAGIAISKANPGLSEAVAGALKEIIDNGEYARIMAKYEADNVAISSSDVKINPLTGTEAGVKAAS